MASKNIKYVGEHIISYVIAKCKENFSPISHKHTADDVGADSKGSAAAALGLAEEYTDEKLASYADTELSTTSENPVQNKVLSKWLKENVHDYDMTVSRNYMVFARDGISVSAVGIDNGESIVGICDYDDVMHEIRDVRTKWSLVEEKPSTFPPSSHTHTISEISDYKIDTELSTTSENPLSNKIIAEKFNTLQSQLEAFVDYEFITTADIDAICGTTISTVMVLDNSKIGVAVLA